MRSSKQGGDDGWAVRSMGGRVVREATCTILRKHEPLRLDGLFDRADVYIAEHY